MDQPDDVPRYLRFAVTGFAVEVHDATDGRPAGPSRTERIKANHLLCSSVFCATQNIKHVDTPKEDTVYDTWCRIRFLTLAQHVTCSKFVRNNEFKNQMV
jgi:hypothetical protein